MTCLAQFLLALASPDARQPPAPSRQPPPRSLTKVAKSNPSREEEGPRVPSSSCCSPPPPPSHPLSLVFFSPFSIHCSAPASIVSLEFSSFRAVFNRSHSISILFFSVSGKCPRDMALPPPFLGSRASELWPPCTTRTYRRAWFYFRRKFPRA